ncbi:MAG TPA: GNAT family N-acetyltransferase, partial [Alphaproteobacteria bacterium]|nr:GNAT family N-acetyltransferase [Alphaproteobacteria bacterium]
VADNPVPEPPFFHPSVRDGTLWVAADARDVPTGFVNCWVENDFLHIDELSVDAVHQRKGIGRALMRTAMLAAQDRQLQGCVLRTFRDIPWNGPFYASLGFVEEEPPELEALIARCVRAERELGLEMARRCTMIMRF